MSSTGRSLKRRADDFYRTPSWVVRALLSRAKLDKSTLILDPCAGDGAILEELSASGFSCLMGIELDHERAAVCEASGKFEVLQGSFFVEEAEAPVIVMNPPFSSAMEFVQKACEAATRDVFVLLRLSFVASAKRNDWMRANPPANVYILPKRPSFTGGGSDSCDYGWFHWEIKPRPSTAMHILSLEECQ